MKTFAILITVMLALLPFSVVGQKSGLQTIVIMDAVRLSAFLLSYWFVALFVGYWLGRQHTLKIWAKERREREINGIF